MPVDRKARSSG